MMKKLSDRFQYYSGILCATGMNVDINDLVHISALLETEEQGLLLKLPCKVGDKVYQVLESIRVFEVTAIGVYDNRIVICTENWETGLGFSFDLKQIGKRYFLTKEEAEAKLKELENENV